MLIYFLKRLAQSLIVIFMVTLCAFMLVRLAPGSPAQFMLPDTATDAQIEAMEIKLGLDKPLYVQFFTYVKGLLQGDLGTSTSYKQPAARIIFARLP